MHLYSAWGNEAMACFAVLHDDRVDSAFADMDAVARAWLNARIQSWKKEVALASRRSAVKGADGNLSICIIPSRRNYIR